MTVVEWDEEVDGVSVVLGEEVVIFVVTVEVSLGDGSSVCSLVFSTIVVLVADVEDVVGLLPWIIESSKRKEKKNKKAAPIKYGVIFF